MVRSRSGISSNERTGNGAKENDRVECICDGFSGSACCLQEIEESLTGHFQLQICLFGRFLWERALSNTTEMVSGHLIVAYESGLKRCVAKNQEEKQRQDYSFWLSLDSHSKQAGNKSYLTEDIPFIHIFHLSFPNHMHHLISL